jgi:PDZ domain-containing protein
LTLLLSGALTVALVLAATVTAVPYVAYEPGPTFNTLGAPGGTPVIAVSGRPTYPTDGHLDLVTISVRSRLTLLEALADWFDRDRAVVPREFVYPPGRSDRDVEQENQQEKLDSETAATTAALRQLGVPFTTTVQVQTVDSALPAAGKLRPGDVITSIDGRAVTTSQAVRDAIAARPVGAQLSVSYTRDGAPGQAVLTTVASRSGPSRPLIGVTLLEVPQYPFRIQISLQDVGGPSAGLMFALGIIDKLSPESLTGGKFIAGTGVISPDGKVGAIGGIAQKMRGARDQGATVFLAPADNCAEALQDVPSGLRLVRVSTLADALDDLRTLRDGGSPPGC